MNLFGLLALIGMNPNGYPRGLGRRRMHVVITAILLIFVLAAVFVILRAAVAA